MPTAAKKKTTAKKKPEPTPLPAWRDSLPAWLKPHVTWQNLSLVGVVLLGVVLRTYRISEPFGGFHAFNEAFYATLGQDSLSKSIVSILFSPSDFNNPPFYILLLYISFKLFGSGEAAARGVSVVASALAILYVYKLGKLLYNDKIGVLAAVTLAVMPGHVLVGRNVQLESALTFLIIASAYYYLKAVKEDKPLIAFVSGSLLGMGLITKLPAILSIPALLAWELWRRRSFKWLASKTTLAFAGGFVLFGMPWYLYQLIVNTGLFIGAQGHLASTFRWPDEYFFTALLYNELLWFISPPLFFGFVASFAWLIYKRQQSDLLVALFAAINVLFYFFYHFHTYYLMPVGPFAALAIARGGYSFKLSDWRRIAIAAVAISMIGTFFSLLMLTGQKYGRTVFANADINANLDLSKTTIMVGKRVMENNGPVLKRYITEAKIINYPPSPDESARPGDDRVVIDLDSRVDPTAGKGLTLVTNLPEEWFRVVVFGYAFGQRPPRLHYFGNGEIDIEKVGSPFEFGLRSDLGPSVYAVYRLPAQN